MLSSHFFKLGVNLLKVYCTLYNSRTVSMHCVVSYLHKVVSLMEHFILETCFNNLFDNKYYLFHAMKLQDSWCARRAGR